MVFQTKWELFNCDLEAQDASDTQTETAGYRTAQQQITSFLSAGVALQAGREAIYNNDEECDNDDYFNEVDTSDNDLLEVSPAAIMAAREVKSAASKVVRDAAVSPHEMSDGTTKSAESASIVDPAAASQPPKSAADNPNNA